MTGSPTGLRLVFLGAPGAGKGTQAADLAKSRAIPHLSTGDMLRREVASGSPIGLAVKEVLDAGRLVPDDLVSSMVGSRIAETDCAPGFVLDGYPRTVAQAQTLESTLAAQRRTLSHVVLFDVPAEELFRRLVARRRGADDAPEVVKDRLATYERQTAPLSEWYRARGLLRAIDGTGTPAQVFGRLTAVLGASR